MNKEKNSMWIVKVYDQQESSLRWRYSDINASVYHPSLPDLRLGYSCSLGTYARSDGLFSYGSNVYTKEKYKKLLPGIYEDVINRALADARKNLAKLKVSEDYEKYKTNL